MAGGSEMSINGMDDIEYESLVEIYESTYGESDKRLLSQTLNQLICHSYPGFIMVASFSTTPNYSVEQARFKPTFGLVHYRVLQPGYCVFCHAMRRSSEGCSLTRRNPNNPDGVVTAKIRAQQRYRFRLFTNVLWVNRRGSVRDC